MCSFIRPNFTYNVKLHHNILITLRKDTLYRNFINTQRHASSSTQTNKDRLDHKLQTVSRGQQRKHSWKIGWLANETKLTKRTGRGVKESRSMSALTEGLGCSEEGWSGARER